MNTMPGIGLTANDLKKLTVTVKGLKTKATFNLSTKALSNIIDKVNIEANELTEGEKYDAIIIPQTISQDEVTVEFEIDTEVFVWKVPASTFAAGTEYIYNVTISRTGVTVTGVIHPWINGKGDDVSAD
jgi:hypothetical protein